jgi:hypothetical protein
MQPKKSKLGPPIHAALDEKSLAASRSADEIGYADGENQSVRHQPAQVATQHVNLGNPRRPCLARMLSLTQDASLY